MPAYLPPPPPASAPGRAVLSVLWTVAMVGFLILVALDFAGLALAPGSVVPRALEMASGATLNAGVDLAAANWSFLGTGSPSATGVHETAGGNPGGFLRTTLPAGTNVVGYWIQSFAVSGSAPFQADVSLDVEVSLGSSATEARLLVYLGPDPGIPSASALIGEASFPQDAAWASTETFIADPGLRGPGTYYLAVAVAADATVPGTATVVGFDNLSLRWSTAAGVVLYLAIPDFVVLFVSQDPSLFLAYFVVLIAVVVVASLYHALRERRSSAAALLAPWDAIAVRLRNRSVWLTVGQVWMALTFFQVSVVMIVWAASGAPPESPLEITPDNAWVLLYELLNASVYEELVFRALLMGVPMAVGSLILRILEVNRSGGPPRGLGSPGRHIAGSARYILGGAVRPSSGREAHLAAWAVLFVSAAIFGLAHAPAWGWWKVLPGFVAGLAFGYLFLRHGVSAAILGHFVNDYASSLEILGVGGLGLSLFIGLLFLALAVAGAGFFAWYAIVAWRELRLLSSRLTGRPIPVRAAPQPPVSVTPMVAAPAPVAPPPAMAVGPSLPPDYRPAFVPPPYGYPPVRFACPHCGWVEARFDGGRFTCTRCQQSA